MQQSNYLFGFNMHIYLLFIEIVLFVSAELLLMIFITLCVIAGRLKGKKNERVIPRPSIPYDYRNVNSGDTDILNVGRDHPWVRN